MAETKAEPMPPLVAIKAESADAVYLLIEMVPGGRIVWNCLKQPYIYSRPGASPWREIAATAFDRARADVVVPFKPAGICRSCIPDEIGSWAVRAWQVGAVVHVIDPTYYEFDVPADRYARILEESARLLRGATGPSLSA